MTARRAWFGRRCLLVLALTLGWLTPLRPVRADDDHAREVFRNGVELYDQRRFAEALSAFRAAYAEKKSPGIKQNIALCLKGLGREAEAATALEEALEEGVSSFRPAVRAAMDRELAELSSRVATVKFSFLASTDGTPIDGARVTVLMRGASMGTTLSVADSARVVHLEPGLYVFTAHRDGYADPVEKKLALVAGAPVDATFAFGALATSMGRLTVRPDVRGATVSVDGAPGRVGTWSGEVREGPHRVVVTASGVPATSAIVTVSAGANVDFPVTLGTSAGEDSGNDAATPAKRAPEPKRYVAVMLAYDGQGFRLAPVLGERAGGSKRYFTGGTFGLRAGYRFSRVFAIEGYGDVGSMSANYALTGAFPESKTSVVHWSLGPILRFTTVGALRFTMATGFGVHGLVVDADIRTTPALEVTPRTDVRSGSGVAASWLGDFGLQLDVGRVFLESAVFFDVGGVGTARHDATGDRFFLSSPGTREGLRLGAGYAF